MGPHRRNVVISKPSRRFDPRDRRDFGPRINDRIRIPEVRVIGAEGEMLGVIPTHEARRLAQEVNLDLVEVNPKAVPPVCKIMDFGRFKYEEKKKQADAKKRQATVELKEIKMRPKTDDHDIAFKVKHVRRFLEEGDKVKLTVRFRGREITHPEMAKQQLDRVYEGVADVALIESSSRMEGRAMTMLLAPKGKAAEKRPRPAGPAGTEVMQRRPLRAATEELEPDLDDDFDDDEDDLDEEDE